MAVSTESLLSVDVSQVYVKDIEGLPLLGTPETFVVGRCKEQAIEGSLCQEAVVVVRTDEEPSFVTLALERSYVDHSLV